MGYLDDNHGGGPSPSTRIGSLGAWGLEGGVSRVARIRMKEEGRVAHATGLDRTSDARDEAKYRALTGLNPREMVLQHGRDWPKGQELARWGAPSSMVIIRRALTPVGHLAVGCYHGLRSLASPSSTLDHSLFFNHPMSIPIMAYLQLLPSSARLLRALMPL